VSGITRRRFIETTAAGTAGLWIATSGLAPAWASGWSPYQDDPPRFPQGVASGDPAADRVVLWTRVAADGPVEVAWEVAETPAFAELAASGTFATGADRDWTVKVDAGGLAAGRTYYYRFRLGEAVSRVGRTRTAPSAASSASLAFALASCQNWTDGYYAAWRHIAARDDLDFVLHVGDYVYEYGDAGVRANDPPHEIVTVDDYRRRYRQYRSDDDLRAAHAAHPFVVTFDDHEVANNSWREGAQNHQPSEGDYLERRNRAYQVYDEYMPVRLPAERTAEEMRVYRKLGFGGLLDVLMLDTRQYRDEELHSPLPVPAPQTNPQIGAEGRTYLGSAQREWLQEELAASTARWRVLGNQAMLAQFTYGVWPDEVGGAMQQLTGMPPDGYPVNSDQWDGYQAEQKRFLRFLRDAGIENTLVCTGDIHMSFANEVYVDEGRFRVEPPVAAELVGPSISSSNFNDSVGAPRRTVALGVEQAIKANNPHIRWCELDSNGYVVVRASASEVVSEWWLLTGALRDDPVVDPNAGERLATAWKVDDGDLTLKWVGGDPVATV
jgi:alkaline phosphatase D